MDTFEQTIVLNDRAHSIKVYFSKCVPFHAFKCIFLLNDVQGLSGMLHEELLPSKLGSTVCCYLRTAILGQTCFYRHDDLNETLEVILHLEMSLPALRLFLLFFVTQTLLLPQVLQLLQQRQRLILLVPLQLQVLYLPQQLQVSQHRHRDLLVLQLRH